MRQCIRILMFGTLFVSALLLILSGGLPSARAGYDTWTIEASPTITPNDASFLRGVSAYDTSHVWAVGEYTPSGGGFYKTLILRNNGSYWAQDASPNPTAVGDNILYGVSSYLSANSDVVKAWAVGDHTSPSSANGTTLIEEWDGSSWSIVSSPNPSVLENHLRAVSVLNDDYAWAVGYSTGYDSLILSWDGSSWSQDTSADPDPSFNILYGVAAGDDDDVWAVGYKGSPSSSALLTEHWDGSNWTAVTAPLPMGATSGQLRSVAYINDHNVWAVGSYVDSGVRKTLAVHWNGSNWTLDLPNNPDTADQLNGAAAVDADNVWGVGHSVSTASTLTELWSSGTWYTKSSQDAGSAQNIFNGVTVTPGSQWCTAGDSWAAGWSRDTNGNPQTLIERYTITACSSP